MVPHLIQRGGNKLSKADLATGATHTGEKKLAF
jgi:hypothetical protein